MKVIALTINRDTMKVIALTINRDTMKVIALTMNKDTMNAEARRGYLAVLGILGSVFMVTGFTSVAVAFCSY